MKVLLEAKLEQNIYDKFRKAGNSVKESMNCLCDITNIDELSFYIFCKELGVMSYDYEN